MNKVHTSYALMVVAQILVGFAMVTSKYLLPILPMFIFLGVRFVVSPIVMAIILFIKDKHFIHKSIDCLKQDKKLIGLLFIQALSANMLFNILLVAGMHYTSAMSAGIISGFLPAVIALLALFALKEKLANNKVIAIGISVIGLILINCQSSHETSALLHWQWLGNGLIILALFPLALYTIITRAVTHKIEPMVAGFIITIFSFLIYLPLFSYQLWVSLAAHSLSNVSLFAWVIAGAAGVGNALSITLWYQGMKNVTATTSALFTSLMPLSALVMAYLFLGEKVDTFDLIGFACVMGAIICGTYRFKLGKIKLHFMHKPSDQLVAHAPRH